VKIDQSECFQNLVCSRGRFLLKMIIGILSLLTTSPSLPFLSMSFQCSTANQSAGQNRLLPFIIMLQVTQTKSQFPFQWTSITLQSPPEQMLELVATSPVQMDQKEAADHLDQGLIHNTKSHVRTCTKRCTHRCTYIKLFINLRKINWCSKSVNW